MYVYDQIIFQLLCCIVAYNRNKPLSKVGTGAVLHIATASQTSPCLHAAKELSRSCFPPSQGLGGVLKCPEPSWNYLKQTWRCQNMSKSTPKGFCAIDHTVRTKLRLIRVQVKATYTFFALAIPCHQPGISSPWKVLGKEAVLEPQHVHTRAHTHAHICTNYVYRTIELIVANAGNNMIHIRIVTVRSSQFDTVCMIMYVYIFF